MTMNANIITTTSAYRAAVKAIAAKNAIAAICRYGNILQNKIIEALEDENWVTKNSAITCIKNLMQDENIDIEKFIIPLTKSANDINPIVQASAISTLALVYNAYKKRS